MEIEKIRRNVLSINRKLQLLKELQQGVSLDYVANKYGISVRTIYRIKKNKKNLRCRKTILQDQVGNIERKRFTGIEVTNFEKILFGWFIQQRKLGRSITCLELQTHARYLNEILGGSESFKASKGWLYKFQQRHGLGESRDKISNDAMTKNCGKFVEMFRYFIEAMEISLDNVYNVDEKGLLWKCIPCKISAPQIGSSQEPIENKDRVTVVTCANSTGTHAVPLLVIGNEKLQLEKEQSLPLPYLYQQHAWMDRKIFKDWFINTFVPAVELKNQYRKEKILLLLENTSSHPPVEELNKMYPQCTVFLLPPNIPSSILPMEQGVIESLKRAYRQTLCSNLLIYRRILPGTIQVLVNNCTLLDCLKMLSTSWASINKRTIRNAWRKILRNDDSLKEDFTEEFEIIKELVNELMTDSFNTQEVKNWLNIDKHDPGWKILSLDEIVQLVLNDEAPVIMSNSDEEENKNVEQREDVQGIEGMSRRDDVEEPCLTEQAETQIFIKSGEYVKKRMQSEHHEQLTEELTRNKEISKVNIKIEQFSEDEMDTEDTNAAINMDEQTSCISASDAYNAMNSVYEWLSHRSDTDPEYLRAICVIQKHISNIAFS